tara:strand:+ start:159 stop:665 length:507 start_codon:yes stop_codon:yes gene_type:complete
MKKSIFILTFLLISISLRSQEFISTTTAKNNIDLRKEASLFSESKNQKILKGSEVTVLDFKNNYWLIKKDTIEGWSPLDFIYKTDKMYDIIKKYKTNLNIKKFGLKDGRKVNLHSVWIGMSKEMLLASYGEPKEKNINIYGKVTHEQWLYIRYYIYLEDGIVTAMQDK